MKIFGKEFGKKKEEIKLELPKAKETPKTEVACAKDRPILEYKLDKATVEGITLKLTQGAPNQVRQGYLIGEKCANGIVIRDVYIPEQTSSIGLSSISPEAQKSALEAIAAEGKTVVGIVQYNNDFAVFDTGSVVRARDEFCRMNLPAVSLVVNAKGKFQVYQ